MKILLVNAYVKSGGASVAARRLCAALNGVGAHARLLVQNAEGIRDSSLLATSDSWASRRSLLDALPTLLWRNRRSPHWGNAWMDNGATRKAIGDFAPDVTHLHWVNHGMLSLRDVARLNQPIVWTLHDSWVFTGGCHSPQACRRFQARCGRCPELNSQWAYDLSRWNWHRKRQVWDKVDFAVVTPSRWLTGIARSSSLLSGRRIETIPNAVDMAIFHPVDRAEARSSLGLPQRTPLIFFGAHGALTDWNKGADLWKAALAFVPRGCPGAESVMVGATGGLGNMPMRVHELGVLPPERLALALAAADATVVPSRMENLPTIVAESLACGTPVAAFAVGGIPEMVRPGATGFLARPHDPEDLAGGICELLAKGDVLRGACVAFAKETYAPETVARRHVELYRSLVKTT